MDKTEGEVSMNRMKRWFCCGGLAVLPLLAWANEPQSAARQSLPVWAMGPFERPVDTPVIEPDSTTLFFCPMRGEEIRWEDNDTFNPAAVVKDDKIQILYRAEDKSGIGIGQRTSRIGLAESADGISMVRHRQPVMYPGNDAGKLYEWPGGCEDPRVAVTEDGLYVMFYSAWDRKVSRLSVATSRDLKHWTKHGPVFADAYGGRFKDTWSKSASIVTQVEDGRQVIVRVNGKYLMYWGESMVSVAVSDDLIHWTPLLDERGELLGLIYPRDYFFDSALTECGPPAVITDRGILLFYNGKNRLDEKRDSRFNAGTYSAGQVLFDLENPCRVLARLDEPFFQPTADFEKSGQYKDGTVFIEGLVFFKGEWFLYYGCADSRVGVAVYRPGKRQ